MKKVAVLTWFGRGRNYGQTLQAFALNHILRKLGYQCELLSYGKSGPRLSEEEINQLTGAQRELQVKFTAFIKRYIDYSPRLREPEDVRRYLQERDFDAVICGSDQIWNMALPSFESVYMLDFDLPYRKIAYAVGMMDLPRLQAANQYPQLSAWLEEFYAVSVRENAGREIIHTFTGGKADPAVVLDPTLLLSRGEWIRAVELPKIAREPYLFCYLFGMSEAQRALIQRMAETYHCRTVVFLDTIRSGFPMLSGIHTELAQCASIEMFLSLIRDAAAVITDSFHGTVFSVLFEKAFFSLESDSDAPERNTDRAATLLGKAGLTHRLLRRGQEDMAQVEEPIDYVNVGKRLVEERRRSLLWLERAVAGTLR